MLRPRSWCTLLLGVLLITNLLWFRVAAGDVGEALWSDPVLDYANNQVQLTLTLRSEVELSLYPAISVPTPYTDHIPIYCDLTGGGISGTSKLQGSILANTPSYSFEQNKFVLVPSSAGPLQIVFTFPIYVDVNIPIRCPFSAELHLATAGMMTSYPFPGVSPLTKRADPLLQFYREGTTVKYRFLSPIEDGWDKSKYFCHEGCTMISASPYDTQAVWSMSSAPFSSFNTGQGTISIKFKSQSLYLRQLEALQQINSEPPISTIHSGSPNSPNFSITYIFPSFQPLVAPEGHVYSYRYSFIQTGLQKRVTVGPCAITPPSPSSAEGALLLFQGDYPLGTVTCPLQPHPDFHTREPKLWNDLDGLIDPEMAQFAIRLEIILFSQQEQVPIKVSTIIYGNSYSPQDFLKTLKQFSVAPLQPSLRLYQASPSSFIPHHDTNYSWAVPYLLILTLQSPWPDVTIKISPLAGDSITACRDLGRSIDYTAVGVDSFEINSGFGTPNFPSFTLKCIYHRGVSGEILPIESETQQQEIKFQTLSSVFVQVTPSQGGLPITITAAFPPYVPLPSLKLNFGGGNSFGLPVDDFDDVQSITVVSQLIKPKQTNNDPHNIFHAIDTNSAFHYSFKIRSSCPPNDPRNFSDLEFRLGGPLAALSFDLTPSTTTPLPTLPSQPISCVVHIDVSLGLMYRPSDPEIQTAWSSTMIYPEVTRTASFWLRSPSPFPSSDVYAKLYVPRVPEIQSFTNVAEPISPKISSRLQNGDICRLHICNPNPSPQSTVQIRSYGPTWTAVDINLHSTPSSQCTTGISLAIDPQHHGYIFFELIIDGQALFSDMFPIALRDGGADLITKPLPVVVFTPLGSSTPYTVMPTGSQLQINLDFHPDTVYHDRVITIPAPEWIHLGQLVCIAGDIETRTDVSESNDGTRKYTLAEHHASTSTCIIEMSYLLSAETKPIKTDFYPLDSITLEYKSEGSTGITSKTWQSPFPNLGWLYPSKSIKCGTDETYGYGNCNGDEVLVEIKPPTPTTMPPVIPNPIPRPSGLENLCDLVLSNTGKIRPFSNQLHEKMCSIPIAGKLVSVEVGYSQVGVAEVVDAAPDRFPQNKAQFSLCDCSCLGYWQDDPNNSDEKKCSRCAVPDCPALFTPNSECTACECVTPQCRRFRTYLFSTLYINPTVLRYLSAPQSNPTFDSTPVAEADLAPLFKSSKTKLGTTMTAFAGHLKNHLVDFIRRHQMDNPNDPNLSSVLESVNISPLVEGSLLVWKITLSIVNTNPTTPIASMSPLFGFPAFDFSLGQLFGQFYTTQHPPSTTDTDILAKLVAQFQANISAPMIQLTPPTPVLKLFTSDAIRAGCLTHEQSLVLGGDKPATLEMLRPCPLQAQYTLASDHATNPTKTDRLNPMWSPCSTPLQLKVDEYESLARDEGPVTKTLNVRQLFPRCVDFAGVDVGVLHHVDCTIDTSTLVYSTATESLMLPFYTSAMLQSFSTNTLSSPAKDHIEALRSGSSQRSSFPRFPSTTIAQCPPAPLSPSKKSKPVVKAPCKVGYYGPTCSQLNTVPPTSMTSSPSALSINSHSHIQWAFMGDNTQELTIVLQASKKPTGNEPSYFVWSQTLATVPIANLYASAQVPSVDQSRLFQVIYDAIAAGNTDFTNIYNDNTNVVVRGYLTRSATQHIELDPNDLLGSGFTFTLPMLCKELDITCRSPQSQFCHQFDGRCRCRDGFIDANPTQELKQDYVVENGKKIDGDGLVCVPICKNGGTWVGNKVSVSDGADDSDKICQCAGDFTGKFCEIKAECVGASPTPHPCGVSSNGFIPFDTATSSCQNDTCQCLGQWTDHLKTSLEPPEPPTNNKNGKNQPQAPLPLPPPCSLCALKPLSSQLYTSPAALADARVIYDSDPQLAPHNTQDEKYSQTYQPAASSHPLTHQRCYIGGTDPSTYTTGNCSKCLCRRGYGGGWCQLHVAYANITYTPRASSDDNTYIYDALTETLLFDKVAEELALSMANFDKSKLRVTTHNRKQHWLEVAVFTGTDFFARNKALLDAQPESKEMAVQQQQSFNQWNMPPSGFDNTIPPNLDDLYSQWGNLNQQLPQTPIMNQDSGQFLGEIGLPPVLEDPACAEQGWASCSSPKRANSTGLIVGLVVGLVGAALLFLLLVLVLLWCRRNERGFWKSAEKQDREEMSNFTLAPRSTFKGSTSAPVSTTTAVSIVPLGGLEMTGSDQSAAQPSTIQSVNNHTQVQDPTLPAHIKGYKDAKGNIFYVNSEDMTTSWIHPHKVTTLNDEAENDYGW